MTELLDRRIARVAALPPQFGQLCAFRERDEEGKLQASWWLAWCGRREVQMVFAVSLIGGLLLLGYCVSRVKASREAKKSVQTLFDMK
jgi:hypothetical protein